MHTHTYTQFSLLQTELNFLPTKQAARLSTAVLQLSTHRRGRHGRRAKPGSHRSPIFARRSVAVTPRLFRAPSIIGFAEKDRRPFKNNNTRVACFPSAFFMFDGCLLSVCFSRYGGNANGASSARGERRAKRFSQKLPRNKSGTELVTRHSWCECWTRWK